MKSILNYNRLNMKLEQKRNTKDAYVGIPRKMESTRACNLSFASIFPSPRGPKL